MTTDVSAEEIEFTGPNDGGWYRTQIPDWIALHPDLRDGSYRLFTIIRSLILEKRTKVRLLTLDQLAFLMVGKNGKPVAASTIKGLLKNLADIGLVMNPDSTRLVSSVGNRGIQSRRRYQINDWPTNRETYLGWRNTWDKLDAYTADWRKTRTDVFAGHLNGQKSDHRGEQPTQDSKRASEASEDAAAPPAKTNETAGHLNGQISDHRGQKSDHRGQKSVCTAGVTSNDPPPLKEFPKGVSSSSGGSTTSPTPEAPGEEEDDTPTAKKVPDAAETVMARTDATAEEAEAVVDAIETEADERHTRLGAPKVGQIDAYVAGFADRDLNRHLRQIRRQRAPEARTGTPAPRIRTVCSLHGIQGACPACREELHGAGPLAQAVIDMYLALGTDREALRPDLARHPVITELALTG